MLSVCSPDKKILRKYFSGPEKNDIHFSVVRFLGTGHKKARLAMLSKKPTMGFRKKEEKAGEWNVVVKIKLSDEMRRAFQRWA